MEHFSWKNNIQTQDVFEILNQHQNQSIKKIKIILI